MNRILVGISDQGQSRDALSLGAALSRTLGADLLIVAAIEYAPLPIDTAGYDRAREEHFARIFAVVDETLGDHPYRRLQLESDAVHALEEVAERERADLVVIGSTHQGVLGRAYPGTTADRLLQGSAVPVVVAPHGYADREHAGIGMIGVGYDGSDEAKAALGVAEDLAMDLACTLRLISVAPIYPDVPDLLAPTRESMFRERLAAGERSVRRVPVEAVLERGDAARELVRQGIDLDLLVVGSRGHGPVMRAIAGSIASAVVRIAPCPVVVVPRGLARADDEEESARAARGGEPA